MPLTLQDNPARTISLSVDDHLLHRLNEVCRQCPNLESRSQLIRELLELGLDLLENPLETLPILVAGIRENMVALAEAESQGRN